MSGYPWNKKNNTFTWLSSLYNPFIKQTSENVADTTFKVLDSDILRLSLFYQGICSA